MDTHKKVCVLDYGSGNVRSVFNMLRTITDDVVVSNGPDDISSATHIVLPGVGAFGAAMGKIKAAIPLPVLEEAVFRGKKPFLGICVGMQVLSEKGYEFGEHAGLGWIAGVVDKLDARTLPLPHVGWNNIEVVRDIPLLAGLGSNRDFYFVHSYVFKERDAAHVIARTEYGAAFNAIIAKDNIFGVQFHPEKSQKAGKALLGNFIRLP